MKINILKNKKLIITIAAVVTALAILTSVFFIYVNDYYRADQKAIKAFASANNIEARPKGDSVLTFGEEDAECGFIFYPGGKVEHTAYIPLMQSLAKENVFCVLIKMPFNLAVFDIKAASGIQSEYPDIKNWYIGGHSLGGSMAASYLSENKESYEGLVLLGSYSTADLSDTDLKVLSVYGSEDKVLNQEKYKEYKGNLPKGFSEVVIDGGCHSYFGFYGAQEGDGTPKISNEEQIKQTTKAIVELIKK